MPPPEVPAAAAGSVEALAAATPARASGRAPGIELRELMAASGPTLLMVGGKGGVGKTTVSCALALEMARMNPGCNILLASTDPAHSIGDALSRGIGPEPVRLLGEGRLFAQELSGELLLRQFVRRHDAALSKLIARGFLLEEKDLTPFFKLAFPGLDEVMAVLALASAVRDGRFQRIVIDTAPTGHTLRLLRLPAAMHQWALYLDTLQEKHRLLSRLYGGCLVSGPEDEFLADLTEQLTQIGELLKDPRRSAFVCVTNPEPLALAETRRLMEELGHLRVSMGPVVLNQVEVPRACPACTRRAELQRLALSQFWGTQRRVPTVPVPRFDDELRGVEALRELAACLVASPALPAHALSHGTAAEPEESSRWWSAERLPPLPATTRLVLFGGKGGVGKTTLASFFAIGHTRLHPGQRTLLLSTDPAHSLSDFFGEHVGPVPRPWGPEPALHRQAIDPEKAFRKMKETYRHEVEEVLDGLAQRSGIDLPTEKKALLGLFDLAPPGLDEMMALAALADHLKAGNYDLIVLDTAPTGHTLRLLQMPDLALDWLRCFFGLLLKYQTVLPLRAVQRSMVELSRKLRLVADLIRDPQACCFIGASIPTRVALAETGRLLASLAEAHVRCHGLVVNRIPQPSSCPACARRAVGAAGLRSFLTELPFCCPVVTVPELEARIWAGDGAEPYRTFTRALGLGQPGALASSNK